MSPSNIFLRDQLTPGHMCILFIVSHVSVGQKQIFAVRLQGTGSNLLEITGEESLLNEVEKILCYGHCVILLRQDGLSNCSA